MFDLTVNPFESIIDLSLLNKGRHWYPEARSIADYFSRVYDVTLNQSAGVIAAYSVNRSWQTNVLTAEERLEGFPSHYQFVENKVDDILQTDSVEEIMQILHGPKISRFFHNILYPESSPYVTIDRHMVEGTGVDGLTVKHLPYRYGDALTVYERLERSIQTIGDALGEPYPAIQATLWIGIRGKGE